MSPISSRRDLLFRAAGGFAGLVLCDLLAREASAAPADRNDPLAPKSAHFEGKAKSVIFLFATGGASHVDTFDHKPQLFADHGKKVTVKNWNLDKGNFEQFLKRPNWDFAPAGQCGTPISGLFPHLAKVADELCVLNAMTTDSPGHDKATLGMHTGSVTFARPSIGSWVSYGLGTFNQNLPSFVVLAPHSPYAGAQTWANDFLPGCHQGTWVVPGREPIPYLQPQSSPNGQRLELDLLRSLNRGHQETRGVDAALEARIRSFETAYGMQMEAPAAFSLADETDATLNAYGINRQTTAGFGWQAIMARRLVERGVRFVELIDVGSSNNWDSHGNMNDHARLAQATDQPIAALLADLKQRGLLESTLVVWTTEFGRTPYNTSAEAAGREHHNDCFSSWMAGGGVKGGIRHGKSDEHGILPAEGKTHVHDLHATILHLLGLDHERLTFRHAGRDYRLTDIAGRVIHEIVA